VCKEAEARENPALEIARVLKGILKIILLARSSKTITLERKVSMSSLRFRPGRRRQLKNLSNDLLTVVQGRQHRVDKGGHCCGSVQSISSCFSQGR
jgi:hypothetical protein